MFQEVAIQFITALSHEAVAIAVDSWSRICTPELPPLLNTLYANVTPGETFDISCTFGKALVSPGTQMH